MEGATNPGERESQAMTIYNLDGLSHFILWGFRRGLDTVAIAQSMKAPEHEIERRLHLLLDDERSNGGKSDQNRVPKR